MTAKEELIELMLSLTPEQVDKGLKRLPAMNIAPEDAELLYKLFGMAQSK